MTERFVLCICLLLTCCGRAPQPDRYPEALSLMRAERYEEVLPLIRRQAKAEKDPQRVGLFRLLEAQTLLRVEKTKADGLKLLADLDLSPWPRLQLQRDMLQTFYGSREDKLETLNRLHEKVVVLDAPGLSAELDYFRYYLGRGVLDGETLMKLLREGAEHGRKAGDVFLTARAYTALGYRLHHAKRYSEAVRVLEAVPLDDPAVESFQGSVLVNLGMCYLRLGSLERARGILERSYSYFEARNNPGRHNPLGELGNYYFFKRDFQKAADNYRRAWDIARRHGEKTSWGANLVNTFMMQDAWEKAEEAARSITVGANTRCQILIGLRRFDEAEALLQKSLADPKLRETPGRLWRTHYLISKVREARGDTPGMLDHLQQAREILEGMQVAEGTRDRMFYFAWIIQFYRIYVDKLVEVGKGKQAFQVAEACRSRLLRENFRESTGATLDWDALDRAARETDRVYLLFWLNRTQSYVWAFTPEKSTALPVVLPAEQEIAARIDDYTGFLTERGDPLAEAPESAHWLVDQLITPLQDYLSGHRRVVVAADASLWNLNLEALPRNGRFLLEEHIFSMTPSLSMAARGNDGATGPRSSMLLMGDPVPAGGYPRLGGAGRELKAAENFLSSAEPHILRGSEAKPSAYAEAGPGNYDLISFAAHGEANRDSPLYSAIILSQPAEGEEFKLYARNIIQIQLKAELVTISSCNGAGSLVLEGEGLVGLAWAFLHAGAQHVVAGLGRVEDQATATLMSRFYDQLSRGETVIEALRKAKLSMVRDGRIPRFWSPFQVYTR
ncbi:MAG: CHAT domain-containing protein [Acidobacteriota bacterium]|nr:CHAT domain-containing protein [Acidobacteriota bacterium]